MIALLFYIVLLKLFTTAG